MLSPEQTTTESKVNIENNNETLPSIYGAIISQKSKKDYLNTYPIKLSKQNTFQYILSMLNYVILTVFFPYSSLLNNVALSKTYWIALIIVAAYILYYIVLMFPIKNKLYVSNVIKAWIVMFAALIYFMVIRK
jgi:hypothetical protein